MTWWIKLQLQTSEQVNSPVFKQKPKTNIKKHIDMRESRLWRKVCCIAGVCTCWGFWICRPVFVPQQLLFPLSSRATHASSGFNTHHVTHTILNHTHTILLISSQTQGLLRAHFITHRTHSHTLPVSIKWATKQGYRSSSLLFSYFLFCEEPILLEKFLHAYNEKARRYNRDTRYGE